MRFQVPQFIEIEDKIFGPLTFKQFIYIVGGIGGAVIAWVLLPRFIAIFIALPLIIFAVALAFYKVNGKPFAHLVESFFHYFTHNKLYLWRKKEREISNALPAKTHKASLNIKTNGGSKLRDLSWDLDVSPLNSTQDKQTPQKTSTSPSDIIER